MGKTKRIRLMIVAYLADRGSAHFSEIKDHLNDSMAFGTTSNQLGNILAKDSRFQKQETMTLRQGIVGKYRVTEWTLRDGASL